MFCETPANKTALTSLPQEWKKWIAENLARACESKSMEEVMVRDGHFELAFVRAAIAEAARGKPSLLPAMLDMPDIDTSANMLRTSDRDIEVLLRLSSPRIVLLGGVLSHDECDGLVALCEPRLVRSPVVDDSDGSMRLDASRTSRGVMLERGETELVGRVEKRLAELAHWPVERGEGLQIQQYGPGDEYRPHFDWFDPEVPGARNHLEHGGQRLATLVMYLSDVEAGGGTAFPDLGMELMPRKGNAVFFQNTDAFHVPDQRNLHAGCPVLRGVKTIANKWLRADRY